MRFQSAGNSDDNTLISTQYEKSIDFKQVKSECGMIQLDVFLP